MLGIGLVISAGVSWILLHRLGKASDEAVSN